MTTKVVIEFSDDGTVSRIAGYTTAREFNQQIKELKNIVGGMHDFDAE